MSSTRLPYSSDLSDREWAILEPLIPPAKPGGRPRSVDTREILNGLSYVLRSGCAWRLLPHEFPPWSTVYHYFRTWRTLFERPKGFRHLPRRWVVERTIAWIGRYRRMSKDYEYLPASSESMIYLAMIRLMLRRLAKMEV